MKKTAIEDMIASFCDEKLNADYKSLCLRALRKLDPSRGLPQMWAAAIVYAVAQNNLLIGNRYDLIVGRSKYQMSADEVADFFGVSRGGMQAKSKMIREELGMDPRKEAWMSKERKENEAWKAMKMMRQMLKM